MANTYTQLFIHAVFAVKYRNALIPLDKREELYAYLAGIINRYPKCKSICIGGTSDHVHLLIRISPSVEISSLMQSVKIGGTNYINDKKITPYKFYWQEGYGAFSVSSTHTDLVCAYINNQVDHHRAVPFLEEYRRLLDKNGVDYAPKYIFSELE